jgi:hypothetical protein
VTDAFEICVTCDRSIHEIAEPLSWKTVRIHRLDPEGRVVRTENALMEVFACKSAKEAITTAKDLALKLHSDGVEVSRVVVKAPYRARYFDDGIYLEAVFPSRNVGPYPTSRIDDTLWETARAQDPGDFEDLIDRHPEAMVELCLLDTKRGSDSDWMRGYSQRFDPCTMKV